MKFSRKSRVSTGLALATVALMAMPGQSWAEKNIIANISGATSECKGQAGGKVSTLSLTLAPGAYFGSGGSLRLHFVDTVTGAVTDPEIFEQLGTFMVYVIPDHYYKIMTFAGPGGTSQAASADYPVHVAAQNIIKIGSKWMCEAVAKELPRKASAALIPGPGGPVSVGVDAKKK